VSMEFFIDVNFLIALWTVSRHRL